MTPFLLAAALVVSAVAPEGSASQNQAAAYFHYSLGQQARLADDGKTAVEELNKAVALDPTAGEIRSELALALRDLDRGTEAVATAREGVRLDSDSPSARLVLAEVLLDSSRGEPEGVAAAAKEYEEAARLQPDPRIYYSLGMMYTRLEKNKEAADSWEKYLELDPGNFDVYQRLGMSRAALGDSEAAAAAFEKAKALRPEMGVSYERLAGVYAKTQQYDQAILNYRKALELDANNVQARIGLGEALADARKFKEALAEADAILKLDAKNTFGLDLRARALRDLKQFDQALEAAAQLRALSPDPAAADYLRVTILEAKRDFAGAAALLEELLKRPRKPADDADQRARNDRVFLLHLGFARGQLNQFAEAAAAFERSLQEGDDPDAANYGYFVEALISAKQYDKALVEVRKARVKYPKEANLAALEAEALRARGDVAGGVAVVEALRAGAPKDVPVLLEVAGFYQKARKLPEAEQALRSARTQDPRNVRVLFALGANLERQKRHDDADQAFREALAIEPESAPILNYLGYMNADRGVKVTEALGMIEKAVGLDPESSAYLDSLGWAYFRLGRFEEAETTLRRALAKDGKNAVMLDHLGDVLKKRGSADGALGFWRRALTGEDDDGELDRALVEKKIRDAERSANAGTNER